MSHSKARLLHSGLDILSREGPIGLSIRRIAEASAMSKCGVLAHVRSQELLALELLNAGAAMAARIVIGPAMESPEGLPRLKA